MNSPSPTSAHGWISIPVIVRAAAAIVRGATGTPASLSACATRWASSACTPGQLARISSPGHAAGGGVALVGGGDVAP